MLIPLPMRGDERMKAPRELFFERLRVMDELTIHCWTKGVVVEARNTAF